MPCSGARRHPAGHREAVTAGTLMLVAWAIELMLGWPGPLFRLFRHPVVWIGALINVMEARLNRPGQPDAVRCMLGCFSTLGVTTAAAGIAIVISRALPDNGIGFALEALVGSAFIASRSLHDHVVAVARPLGVGNLTAARAEVSMLVGRDTTTMDQPEIARAALESLAENTSDGVVAPIFWGALFGLPGLVGYKAINTLDSMIGHRNERFAAYGGFAARVDDVVNLIPARLTGTLIVLAAASPEAWRVMIRDARRHRSPNAGWPEAALAGALGVRLSGPRTYAGRLSDEPWLNPGAPDPSTQDVRRGLTIYRRTMAFGAVLLLAAVVAGAAW